MLFEIYLTSLWGPFYYTTVQALSFLIRHFFTDNTYLNLVAGEGKSYQNHFVAFNGFECYAYSSARKWNNYYYNVGNPLLPMPPDCFYDLISESLCETL